MTWPLWFRNSEKLSEVVWLWISQEAAGLWSSEGLTGVEGSLCKLAHLYGCRWRTHKTSYDLVSKASH
jgi:hypothetical protein